MGFRTAYRRRSRGGSEFEAEAIKGQEQKQGKGVSTEHRLFMPPGWVGLANY